MTAPSKDKLLEELRSNGVVDAVISQAMSKLEQLVSGSNSANYKQMNPMAIFAVVLHTSEAYQMINPSLRRGEFDKWPCYCYYHALGIQQIPKKQTTVYRGLDVKVELAAYREGCFVSFGGVCSASKQRQKAWNRGTLFVIYTLTGADVQPFSLHPSEAEVTLQSGALYKVIAFSEGPDFHEVKLEEHSPEISSDHLAERDRAEQQLRELRVRFDGLRSELCVSEERRRELNARFQRLELDYHGVQGQLGANSAAYELNMAAMQAEVSELQRQLAVAAKGSSWKMAALLLLEEPGARKIVEDSGRNEFYHMASTWTRDRLRALLHERRIMEMELTLLRRQHAASD